MHFHYQLGGGWRPVLVIHIYCFVIFIVNIHFFSDKFCPQPFSFYHFGADVNFSAANADVDFGANKGMPRVDFGLNTYNSTGLARIKLVFTE